MNYTITTFSSGDKYSPIENHWKKRVQELHPEAAVKILRNFIFKKKLSGYAWWDIVRLERMLKILRNKGCPVINCDLDLILAKNIRPLIDLEYDLIISKEVGGDMAFPPEISKQLGFGLCTGFYIAKKGSLPLLTKTLYSMKTNEYNSNSDQVTLMNYILKNKKSVNFKTERIQKAPRWIKWVA